MKITKLLLLSTALFVTGCNTNNFKDLKDGYSLQVLYGNEKKIYYKNNFIKEIKYKTTSDSITVNYTINDKIFNDYYCGPLISYVIVMS